MFRKMRRFRQLLSDAACAEILTRGTSGVLAVSGDGNYPYAVPLNYLYDDKKIYFHGALSDIKLTRSPATTRFPSAWSIWNRTFPLNLPPISAV